MDYSVPVDFHLYNLKKGASTFASIYIGNAPQKTRDASDFDVIETSHGKIRILRSGSSGNGEIEIYIIPRTKGASVIHIFGVMGVEASNELSGFLSSIRPCKSIRVGGQQCPISDVWSREILKRVP